ncbi:hypothetical protein A2U01_0091695, partial [Trifolium medium]|nr:hypothetical protein [Trifolium medium]
PRDPIVVSEPMVRRRVRPTPLSKIFLTKVVRRRVPLSSGNGGASGVTEKTSA